MNTRAESGACTALDGPAGRAGRVRAAVCMFLVLAFSAFYLWQAVSLPPLGRNVTPSPRLFPVLVGLLLVFSSGVLFARSLLGDQQSNIAVARLDEDEQPSHASAARDLVFTISILIVFVIVMKALGFYVAAAGLMFVLATFFEPAKWLRNLLASLFVIAMTYGVFRLLLNIPLPSGTLW